MNKAFQISINFFPSPAMVYAFALMAVCVLRQGVLHYHQKKGEYPRNFRKRPMIGEVIGRADGLQPAMLLSGILGVGLVWFSVQTKSFGGDMA